MKTKALVCRDADGRLPVIAGRIVAPSNHRNGAEPAVHDTICSENVEWLAGDASMYVTIVNDSISAALPKVAVMSLVERAVNRELLSTLQEKLLKMPQQSLILMAGDSALTASPGSATSAALADIESAMVDVRLAAHQSTVASTLEPKQPGESMFEVSVLSLALANFSRRLSAANQVRTSLVEAPGDFVSYIT